MATTAMNASPRATRARGATSNSSTSLVDPTEFVPAGTNLVVLRGVIRRTPEYRVLPSGDELLSFDLTIRDGEQAAESVPIVWHHPTAAAAKLAEGDDVVVVGRVRRRFFRAGGSTASRTEVHADKVLGARSSARIRSALEPRVEDLNL